MIPVSSTATLFRAGDRLRLIIAGRTRKPLFGHFPTHYEPSRQGKATIHWTLDHPSCLELPVIPAT